MENLAGSSEPHLIPFYERKDIISLSLRLKYYVATLKRFKLRKNCEFVNLFARNEELEVQNYVASFPGVHRH